MSTVKLETFASHDPDMGHPPGKDWAWSIRSSAYPHPRIIERGMPKELAQVTARYMADFLGAKNAGRADGRNIAMRPARDYLIELHNDFRNNYLTVAVFAEHNGLHESEALALLSVAHVVSGHPHPEA